MSAAAMRASVKEDLKHIPKKDLNQSILRMSYNAQRMADLGGNGSHCSRGASLQQAMSGIAKPPDYTFQFDKDYFQV